MEFLLVSCHQSKYLHASPGLESISRLSCSWNTLARKIVNSRTAILCLKQDYFEEYIITHVIATSELALEKIVKILELPSVLQMHLLGMAIMDLKTIKILYS